MTVWRRLRRRKVKVGHLPGNPPPGAHITHKSTYSLPSDFLERIIAHLTCNLDTLKACSLVCRSWYIVAVPHLHHTLTFRRERCGWPNPPIARARLKPLSQLYQLGLMPHVKEVRVEEWEETNTWFVPQTFSCLDLRYFSAFANVHTLKLQALAIDRFIPDIERYFGQFLPTLRAITLYKPRCNPRQLSYFLSFFSNLDDIELQHSTTFHTVPTKLEPFSTPAPKLRGRLALYDFPWVGAWTHLIASCGGLRLRHMDLREDASCAPVLFEACSETLETLRFNVPDAPDSKCPCMGLSTDSS